MVGCCSDAVTHKYKGQTVYTEVRVTRVGRGGGYGACVMPPFLTRPADRLLAAQSAPLQEERYETMRHCKWADEVVPDSPWVLSEEFLKKVRENEAV